MTCNNVIWDKIGNGGDLASVGEDVRPPTHQRKYLTITDAIVSRLQALDEQYTAAVNEAIAADRDDLVRQLAAEYPDAAAEIMESEAA